MDWKFQTNASFQKNLVLKGSMEPFNIELIISIYL